MSKRDGSTANANNQVLQTLTDSGLPGLAVLVGLLLSVARRFLAIALRRDQPVFSAFYHGALLWLLALVFGDLAAVWLLPSFAVLVLWILLGMPWPSGHCSRTRHRSGAQGGIREAGWHASHERPARHHWNQPRRCGRAPFELVKHQRASGMTVAVAYLRGHGYWAEPMRRLGVQVHALRLRFYGDPAPVLRLRSIVRGADFDLLHAHLPPAELYARLALLGMDALPGGHHQAQRRAIFPRGRGARARPMGRIARLDT